MRLVSTSDILDVTKEFKRPLIEGEAVLDGKQLVAFGRLGDEHGDGILKIRALCLQTSGIFQDPHKIDIVLDLNSVSRRLKSLSCSCKAGSSEKCKHLVATLMHLNKLEDQSELDILSSTDLEQQWGKLKAGVKMDYDATPIHEYCHYPEKSVPIYSRGIPDIEKNLASELAAFILADEDSSAISLHKSNVRAAASAKNCSVEREIVENAERSEQVSALVQNILVRSNLNSSCMNNLKELTQEKIESLSIYLKQFYKEKVEVSAEKTINISSSTVKQSGDGDVFSGGKLWFNERKLRITGSKCYVLYTYASNKDPDWNKKLKSVFNSSFKGNQATTHGIMCEPLAREAYVNEMKKSVVESGLFVHPYLPWLGYSPDGIIVTENGEPEALLEIKSPLVGKTSSSSSIVSEVSFCVKKTKN